MENTQREIKFRAWDKKNEVIKYDIDQIYYDKMEGGLEYFLDGGSLYDNIIWMQYTGLKDKNGVEIYEGDLLQNTLHETQIIECYCSDEVIGSAGYAFKFRKLPNDSRYMFAWETTDIEVIGNIYENPELLTK